MSEMKAKLKGQQGKLSILIQLKGRVYVGKQWQAKGEVNWSLRVESHEWQSKEIYDTLMAIEKHLKFQNKNIRF